MADFGCDVSDYIDIEPMFGTLSDFDHLIGQAHSRGLKVILDFVPNHTSELHPWFLESRSSRDHPKRDWYIWAEPRPGGGRPNNWLSIFGGPAWEWDAVTGQYYLHSFLREQPDLNWRNPEVQQAVFDALSFWLDRGVDGFRFDTIHYLVKATNCAITLRADRAPVGSGTWASMILRNTSTTKSDPKYMT